jgi:glucan biosynthesis protein C
MDRYRSWVPWLLVASVCLYFAFLAVLERWTEPAAAWLLALFEAWISVWMTCACLCMGRLLLNRHHRLMRYFSEVSYWTYIVHLPILFAIQYRLMDWSLPWHAKFALSVLLTMGACLLSYELLVRHTVLARILGARPGTAVSASAKIRPAA